MAIARGWLFDVFFSLRSARKLSEAEERISTEPEGRIGLMISKKKVHDEKEKQIQIKADLKEQLPGLSMQNCVHRDIMMQVYMCRWSERRDDRDDRSEQTSAKRRFEHADSH